MKLWRLLFLVLLLTAALGEVDEEEDIYEGGEDEIIERAFLVARKKILESEISEGANFTVVLTVHNPGTRAAANIVITEGALPKDVELLSTDVATSPIKLLESGSTLTYRTVLRPQTTGYLLIQPAQLTYAPYYGSVEKQFGFSTPASLTVLTTNEYLGLKILMLGSYMTLGVLNTKESWIRFGILSGAMLSLFAMNYLWKKLSEARKERLRRRATEIIEKSK